MRLLPLGDQALIVYLDDEPAALQFAAAVHHGEFPWVVDVVQAYTSVAVFFDLGQMDCTGAAVCLQSLALRENNEPIVAASAYRLPCCYEMGLDLQRVAEHTRLAVDEIIRLHSGTVYTVYAIGFCPGFPYLGYLPPELSGVPRLPVPRLRVERGSVGLTGRQTGIYTEVRPGGWNIIARTPLELVNVTDGYFPLRTGDRVQFLRIDDKEFQRLQGQRL